MRTLKDVSTGHFAVVFFAGQITWIMFRINGIINWEWPIVFMPVLLLWICGVSNTMVKELVQEEWI